jgi:hypothetical protein
MWSIKIHSFPEKELIEAKVVHAYNPSYLGGRDWDDWDSNPAWAES